MLFEMLTGRRAFSEDSPVEMMLRIRAADVATDLVPQIDEAYRPLLTAMLARDESERPSASNVAEKLAASASTGSQ